jgi:hypothetical protein
LRLRKRPLSVSVLAFPEGILAESPDPPSRVASFPPFRRYQAELGIAPKLERAQKSPFSERMEGAFKG